MPDESDATWLSGGAREEIVTVGDPRLREPVEPFDLSPSSIQRLEQMVELLRNLKGAGLAAPQVGWSAAAAVVEVRKTAAFPDRPESPLILLINPVVTAVSDDLEVDWEGCFSVPGLMGRVPRPREVELTFTDRGGEEITQGFRGYVARVIQHELDHLENRIFLDRMPSMDTLSTIDNWQRFSK